MIIHVTTSLWSKVKWLSAHGNIVRPLKKVTTQPISHYEHSLVTCRQNVQSNLSTGWGFFFYCLKKRWDGAECVTIRAHGGTTIQIVLLTKGGNNHSNNILFIIWQWILIALLLLRLSILSLRRSLQILIYCQDHTNFSFNDEFW